jgi:hypothetical protein
MVINLENTITKPRVIFLLLFSFAFTIVGYMSFVVYIAYAQTNADNSTNASTPTNIPAANSTNQGLTTGRIVGLVNDQTGIPSWILSGKWSMNVPTVFNSTITMVKPDGTGSHRHRIIDFTPIGNSVVNTEELKAMNGTSTITMPEGTPFKKVPTSVRLMNNSTVSIMIDPKRIESHFGNAPIYGISVP